MAAIIDYKMCSSLSSLPSLKVSLHLPYGSTCCAGKLKKLLLARIMCWQSLEIRILKLTNHYVVASRKDFSDQRMPSVLLEPIFIKITTTTSPFARPGYLSECLGTLLFVFLSSFHLHTTPLESQKPITRESWPFCTFQKPHHSFQCLLLSSRTSYPPTHIQQHPCHPHLQETHIKNLHRILSCGQGVCPSQITPKKHPPRVMTSNNSLPVYHAVRWLFFF
jgi:hypothetical protein